MPRVITSSIATVLMCVTGATVAEAEWNDPTRPDNLQVAAARAGAPVFRVSAIFTSNAKQVAVLNGRLVREGDRLGRATVTRIDEDRVTLSVDKKTMVATLNKRRNGR